MEGLIFSVRRYSIHDGPGIRVTFFMKGCPLSCIWCHNPEGIYPFAESVNQTKRVGGREFVHKETVGMNYSVENVIEILEKERVFIETSGGGVTFSGGEPLLQSEFLVEALKACKTAGYHTAVDTSGYASREKYQSIMPFTDLFLFDLKHLEEKSHMELTGVSNKIILENYHFILESDKAMIVRIPVIPGYNDDTGHLEKLKAFLSASKSGTLRKISLLPYHKIGSTKYKKFNIPYRMRNIESPAAERMEELKEFFIGTGINVKTGG